MWWVGGGRVGGYEQLCYPASPKLLLGLDLGLGCDNNPYQSFNMYVVKLYLTDHHIPGISFQYIGMTLDVVYTHC